MHIVRFMFMLLVIDFIISLKTYVSAIDLDTIRRYVKYLNCKHSRYIILYELPLYGGRFEQQQQQQPCFLFTVVLCCLSTVVAWCPNSYDTV